MKEIRKKAVFLAAAGLTALALSGWSAGSSGKRIVRISHAQSETHPEHLGLLAFKEYVEERLGDKYEVQIFPNELLGSAQKAIELTQTGAMQEPEISMQRHRSIHRKIWQAKKSVCSRVRPVLPWQMPLARQQLLWALVRYIQPSSRA